MPKVSFKETGESQEVSAASLILDLCNDMDSGIPFGCRSGVCGTCLSDVVEGALAPATEEEKATLEGMGTQSNQRLACQACVGDGDVLLAPAD